MQKSFSFGVLRRTVETRLAAAGVTSDVRAHLQSHGLGGVQTRHYDRHDYLEEKRLALESAARSHVRKPTKVSGAAKDSSNIAEAPKDYPSELGHRAMGEEGTAPSIILTYGDYTSSKS